jgi:outer membrane protein TolC
MRSVILILSLTVGASAEVPAGQVVKFNLQDALDRCRANSPQLLSATSGALVAREDRVQAQAGLLPTLNYFNQSICPPANGTPSQVWVANQAGKVSVLEVVDAQTTLAQARNAYEHTMVRYRVAPADLQTLTGGV